MIDAVELRRLYVDCSMSAPAIAAELGCNENTVYRALRKHGISVRSKRDAGRMARTGTTFDDREAARLYRAGWSGKRIAAHLHASKSTVFLSLERQGIQRRGKREAACLHRNAAARRSSHPRNLVGTEACAICGVTDGLEVHHVNADRSDDSEGNLLWLCWEHHVFVEWLVHRALAGLGAIASA